MQISKFRKITTYFCIALLVIVMITILVRTITRQVLVKALGISNVVTELILFDNEMMQEERLGKGVGTDEIASGKIEIDWARIYPFDKESTHYKAKASNFDKYTKLVEVITTNTDYYTSKFLPAYDYWVERYQIYRGLINCIGNNRSQAHKNSGLHYLRACRPIFPY